MHRPRTIVAAVGAVVLIGLIAWIALNYEIDAVIPWISGGIGLLAALAIIAVLVTDPSRLDQRGPKQIWVIPVIASSILIAVASLSRGMTATAVACGLIAAAAVVVWFRSPRSSSSTTRR
jgi:hypothetical protein